MPSDSVEKPQPTPSHHLVAQLICRVGMSNAGEIYISDHPHADKYPEISDFVTDCINKCQVMKVFHRQGKTYSLVVPEAVEIYLTKVERRPESVCDAPVDNLIERDISNGTVIVPNNFLNSGFITQSKDSLLSLGKKKETDVIFIDADAWNESTMEERKGLIAHEIAHAFLGHINKSTRPDNWFLPKGLTENQAKERITDCLACALCGTANWPAQSLIMLHRSGVSAEKQIKDEQNSQWLEKGKDISSESPETSRRIARFTRDQARQNALGNRSHPGLRSRIHTIAAYAEEAGLEFNRVLYNEATKLDNQFRAQMKRG